MKLLLPCDNYLYRYHGNLYAKSQEEYDLFKRYIRIFESLRLVARCSTVKELKPTCVPVVDNRIEVVSIPMFRGPVQFLKYFWKIRKCIKGVFQDVDAGMLRLPSIMGSYIGFSLIINHIPYATENVYDSQDGYRSSEKLSEKILWRLMDFLQRNLCYRADGVSCVTQYYMQRRYFSKKCGSFSSHYSTLALDPSFYTHERIFPSQKDSYIIVHIANPIVTQGRKGHEEMIKMLGKVKEKSINATICFIGGGEEREIKKLKKLAQDCGVVDNVMFTGYISKSAIHDYLLNADLFVMPTKAEGLPRVVIEAMSAGLPCISSRVSGLPELLQGHFLTDYHDVDTLSKLVIELLTTPELYEKTSRRNFEKSKEYEASLLEKRRDVFYQSLRKIVKKS